MDHATQYRRALDLVRHGFLGHVGRARQLAEKHDFPLEQLEEALPLGNMAAYEAEVELVKYGALEHEQRARELAAQHVLPIYDLKKALPVGRQRAYETELKLIGSGDLIESGRYLDCVKRARELSSQYGFPARGLDDAIEKGRQTAYENKLRLIRAGFLGHEAGARQLVEEHDRSIKSLEDALVNGRQAKAK